MAVGALISLANVGFAADDGDRSQSDRSSNAVSGQAENQSSNLDQNNRTGRNDDDATHHASLGVSLSDSDGRVTVLAVMPGSPAAKAGLRAGDEIRYVGDQRVRDAQSVAEEIADSRPGSQIDLSIRRDGEKQTLKATLGSRDRSAQNWVEQQSNQGNRSAERATRNRRAYSNDPNDQRADGAQLQQRQQVRQHIQALQQQVSQLQQEINNLQATVGDSQTRSSGNQLQNGGQQGYNNGQQGRMLDRTGQRYSTARGWSRDHGPRETDNGNPANED
jgi:membrane-associated protease RseP (regulator of RpoE activity)